MEANNGQYARNDKVVINEESMNDHTVTPYKKNDNAEAGDQLFFSMSRPKFIINITDFLERDKSYTHNVNEGCPFISPPRN